jgi:hypothetical protein
VEANGVAQRDSGTAFLTEVNGTPLAVTAFHVVAFMGAPGDVPASAAAYVNPFGREIVLESFAAPSQIVRPVEILGIDSVTFGGPTDVGAMLLPGTAPHPTIPLALELPRVGDTVWLHTQLRGAGERGLFHPATVVATDSGWVMYVFHEDLRPPDALIVSEQASIASDTSIASELRPLLIAGLPAFHLAYSSGAPVLDRGGRVVALNVIGGTVANLRETRPACCPEWPETQLHGGGVPATTVQRLIAAGLRGR